MYAWALTALADCAAFASLCTRTRLKSCPRRDSIKPRVRASIGWPGDRNTSCTTEGKVDDAGADPDDRRYKVDCFFLHSSHCSPMLCWPQAHLRCRSRPDLCATRTEELKLSTPRICDPLMMCVFLASTTWISAANRLLRDRSSASPDRTEPLSTSTFGPLEGDQLCPSTLHTAAPVSRP